LKHFPVLPYTAASRCTFCCWKIT